MHPGSPRQRIYKFIASHECDLMVLATHHRTALMRLVSGSVAAGVSDDSRVPTLFLRGDSKGFIDLVNGACHLETVLIPIGSEVDVEILRKIEPSSISSRPMTASRCSMSAVSSRPSFTRGAAQRPRHSVLSAFWRGAALERLKSQGWANCAPLCAPGTMASRPWARPCGAKEIGSGLPCRLLRHERV
jgi:hypothetical protein